MLNILKIHKFKSVLMLSLLLLGPAGTTASSLILMNAINALVARDMRGFLTFGALSLLCVIVAAVARFWGKVLYSQAIQDYNDRSRQAIVESAVQNFKPFEEYDVSTGINETTNDLTIINQSTFVGFIGIYLAIANVCFAFFGLLTMHWSLMLATLVLGILMLLPPYFSKKPLQRATQNVSRANNLFITDFKDWMSGLSEMFWARQRAGVWHRIAPSSAAVRHANVEQVRVTELIGDWMLIQSAFSQMGLLLLTGILLFNNIVSVGVVFLVGNLTSQSFSAMNSLVSNLSLQVSGQKIFEKNDERVQAYTGGGKKTSAVATVPMTFNQLSTHDLAVQFPGQKEITYPDLEINRGDKVLIVGSSGSGKSTLIKALVSTDEATTDAVDYNGLPLAELSPEQLTAFIDLMPQKVKVFDSSIGENIRLGNPLSEDEMMSLLDKAGLKERIVSSKKGLDSVVGKDIELSGGELQRLAFVRVLARSRQILIVDEGTSALDKLTARQLVDQIKALKETTVLFITHSVDEVLRSKFDHVLDLDKGTFNAQG